MPTGDVRARLTWACRLRLGMASLLGVSNAGLRELIQPWEPPISSFLIGIDHALTFSANLLCA